MTKLEQRLDDLEHDLIWLIQHGWETESYQVVQGKVDKLAARVRRLRARVERKRSLPHKFALAY